MKYVCEKERGGVVIHYNLTLHTYACTYTQTYTPVLMLFLAKEIHYRGGRGKAQSRKGASSVVK